MLFPVLSGSDTALAHDVLARFPGDEPICEDLGWNNEKRGHKVTGNDLQ